MKITTCSQRTVLEPCSLESMNYQIDPYIGCEHNCYYCYALKKAETDWKEEIQIHQDITSQLERELDGIEPQKIYMGYHTDPYQPCEGDCRQTRAVLELLLEKGFSAGILTKSDLVVRDIDLLKQMEDANVSVSVAFTDDQVRRQFEYNTVDTELRINGLYKIKKAGIGTSALVCPVIPLITDVKSLLEKLIPCIERIWIYGISIENPDDLSWLNIQNILETFHPEKKQEIESIIFNRNHPYWIEMKEELSVIKSNLSLDLRIHI